MSWTKSIEDAKKSLSNKNDAFAIYFADAAKPDAFGEKSIAVLKKAGINVYVKIIHDMSNIDVCKKYDAVAGTLVLCDPTGEKISSFAGEKCTVENLTAALEKFPAEFEAFIKNKAEKSQKEKEAAPTK